jgi:hypothetical protein
MSIVIPKNSANAGERRIPFVLVDATDLITPEDITVTGVKVQLSFAGATDAASTNDIVKVDGAQGMYYIELTQTEANTAYGAVHGYLKPTGCAACYPFAQIGPEGIYSATVDVGSISGDSTAADNLEAMFDGTGYAGGTTKLQVNAVSIGSQTASASGTITFPAATLASTTNITAATGVVLSGVTHTGAVIPTVSAVSGAVGSVTGNVGGNVAGSVGSVTGNVGGNVTGSIGSITAGAINAAAIGTGAITSAKFAAGAIDAAAIATDAIGASELATDAVNEIVTAIFARTYEATKMSGVTFEELTAMIGCTLLAKASGMGTTSAVIRNFGDTADVVAATVDASGNRTAVTRTLTSVR